MKSAPNMQRYGMAVIACTVAFAAAWLTGAQSSCLFLAVMVSGLYGGKGPGLLSVGLSTLAFNALISWLPQFPLAADPSRHLRFGVFVGAVLLVNHLISIKRRSDEARRESDEYYRIVAEAATDAILSFDENKQIVFANEAARKIFGWSVSDLTGRPLSMVMKEFPPDGTSPITEVVGLRSDGTEFPAEISFAEVVRDGRRNITGFVRDISERRQVHEALRESERNLSLIIDTIPALVWCAVPDGKLEYVNQRIIDYLGVPVSDLIEHGWINFLHPDDVEPTLRSWFHAVATGTRHEVEYRMRCSDGAYRWFHVLGQPLRNNEGRIVRWYGLLADIEDRKNVAETLRRTQARLSQAMQIATIGELAASIAHEVNQPLAAVVANGHACLRWLQAQPPNLAEANLAAERIIFSGNAAADVVRRIRALFKRSEPEKVPLNLNEVIAEVIHLLAGDIVRQGVAVETDLFEELPPVMADRLQLQQVIFNLIQNGIEAMANLTAHPKKLVIQSKQQDASIFVEIRDYGPGLNDYDKPFEAFYTTKESGMGMGLAICRSILDAHHGWLWATPTEGPGATFCLTLPLNADTPASPPSISSSS
jgi:PAS domain S-box-containing protein